MELKNKFTGEVIYSGDFKSMTELLSDAISNGANLQDANLRDANLRGCAGNCAEIRSIFVSEMYPITYTSEHLQIGCERHLITDWWDFDNDRIKEMDGDDALRFWAENKEFIKMTIDKYPATPTEYQEAKESEVA